MRYEMNVREEVFGGTVLNLQNGKRFYITSDELKKLTEDKILPSDIGGNKITGDIKYVKSRKNKSVGFSFANIAFFEITRGCNLRCKHCLNNSGMSMETQLDKDEIINLISRLSDAGIQEIRFTGGEPLIHPNLLEFISYATSVGIYVSIGTNGTLLTKDLVKSLKSAGLKRVIVSLDGTEEAHNQIRGEGNFEKTVNGIEYLKEENISLKVNSVIMRSNMDDVIKLAKRLHNEKTSVFIRRFIESGRGASLVNNMLSKADYDYVRNELQYELQNGPYVRGHYIRLTDDGSESRIELPFEVRYGCKVGQRALVITPNGDVHYCGFLAAQGFPALGNVRSISDFVDFWESIQKNERLELLENNLDKYNSFPNIQTTNCLAYVQNFLNNESTILTSKETENEKI